MHHRPISQVPLPGLVLAASLMATPAAHAQNVGASPSTDIERIGQSYSTPSGARAAGRPDASLRIGGGFIRQFDADVDGGGDFAVSRAYASVSGSFALGESVAFSPSIAYEFGDYSFAGAASAAFPWERVNEVGIAPRFDIQLDRDLTVSLSPIIQFAAEDGAGWGNAAQWGGLGAIRYSFAPELTLGAGLLGLTQLEGDPLFIPIPLIDWKIDQNWRVSNLRVPEANPFAALEVVYDTQETLEFAAGGGWETRRFRLDDGGVGQDRGAAFYARVTARLADRFRVDGLVGFTAFNQLKALDSGGATTASRSADTGLILGIFGSVSF
jgi:hypothetical protein